MDDGPDGKLEKLWRGKAEFIYQPVKPSSMLLVMKRAGRSDEGVYNT